MDYMDISRDDWIDPLKDVPGTIGITCAVNHLEMMEDPPIPFGEAFNGNEEMHDRALGRSSSLGSIAEFSDMGTSNKFDVNEMLLDEPDDDPSLEKNQADVYIETCTPDTSLVHKNPTVTMVRTPPVEASNLPGFEAESRFPNAVSKTKQLTSTRHRLHIATNGEQSIDPHRKAKVAGLERPDEDEDKIRPGRAGSGSTSPLSRFQVQSIHKRLNVHGKFNNPLVEQGKLEEFFDNGGAAANDMIIAGTSLECSIDTEEMMFDEEVSRAIFQNDTEEAIQASLELYDWEVSQARIRISDVHVEGDSKSSFPANWIAQDIGNNLLPPAMEARGPRKARGISASVGNESTSSTGSGSSCKTTTLKAEKLIEKKRKISKREAARAKSAAVQQREDEIARLAKENKISDDELLRLKPKKQRRAAKFAKPIASRFCHICSRTPKNVNVATCSKIKMGICRKVICEKCFIDYKYGDFELAADTPKTSWTCTHCKSMCPARAQCRTYQRINDRLRANRLKQVKPKARRKSRRSTILDKVPDNSQAAPESYLLPAALPTPAQPVTLVHDAACARFELASLLAADNRSPETPTSADRPPRMPTTSTEVPNSPSTPTSEVKVPLTVAVEDGSQGDTAEVDNEAAPEVQSDTSEELLMTSSPIGSDDVKVDMELLDDIIHMPVMSDEGQGLVFSLMGASQREGPKKKGMAFPEHEMEDF